MAKVNYRKLPARKRAQMEAELKGMLHGLGMKDECWQFLRDLLTESEIIMLARRLEVSRWLLTGESSHHIAGQLGVGLTTVYGVDRWLQKKFREYRSVLAPLFKDVNEDVRKRFGRKIPLDSTSFRALRKRYPAHFLLLNLLLGDPHEYELDD